MAKIQVKYSVEMSQTIDWPDDELDNFNYDNLVCSCDPDKAEVVDYNFDIQQVSLNGKPHDF
jgi:hypothetical protein